MQLAVSLVCLDGSLPQEHMKDVYVCTVRVLSFRAEL